MDILDFFANMGVGLTIIVGIIFLLFLIMIMGSVIPILIYGLGYLFITLAIIVLVGIVIYFIGKFARDLVKW